MPPLTPPESNAAHGDPPSAPASVVNQTDEALRASEARYRALATASADVIYRMSPDWREMHQLDGRGFLVDMPSPSQTWIESYILPEDQPHVSAVIAEAVRTGAPFELEHRVRQANGAIGWTHSRAVPIRDVQGTVVEWIGAARDVTAQKTAEAALRESEQRFRTLFETMGQGYGDFELVRDDSGRAVDQRYLTLNPAFERIFGIPAADAIGRTASEVFPELESWWYDAFDRIARRGEPERIEYPVASLGRWFEVFAYPRGGDRLTVLYEDITERRRAEDALREREERQRFLLAVGDAMRAEPSATGKIEIAARHLGERLSASRVLFAEFDEGRGVADIFHGWLASGAQSFPAVLRLEDFEGPVLDDLRGGRTVRIDDVASHAGHQHFAALAQVGVQALLSVPLLVGGRLAVNLSVHQQTARQWTDDDVALVEDVAERLWAEVVRARAEAALLESEQRYRRIVEQATDYAIFSTDAARRIETWSLGAEVTFGWTPEEAIGQLMDITFTPEDRVSGHIEREFAQAREEGSAPNVRWHQRKDGSPVFIDGMSYARQGENGAFQGIFKVGQDVTARLQAEEVQRETEARYREVLEAEVAAATGELRTLSRRLLLVQEEERRKLALELHDEIGQVLTGLTFQIAAAQGRGGEAALAEANVTVQTLTEQVRQLALDLRPQVLDRYGLLLAVQWYIERFQTTTGITIHLFEEEVAQRRYSPEVEIAAFRLVQEALTNIARYAAVSEAWVTLIGDGSLLVVIHDQGQGFDSTQPRESSGIGGMRERVALLGGHFTLETAPGEGVHITAEFPLDDAMATKVSSESAP